MVPTIYLRMKCLGCGWLGGESETLKRPYQEYTAKLCPLCGETIEGIDLSNDPSPRVRGPSRWGLWLSYHFGLTNLSREEFDAALKLLQRLESTKNRRGRGINPQQKDRALERTREPRT